MVLFLQMCKKKKKTQVFSCKIGNFHKRRRFFYEKTVCKFILQKIMLNKRRQYLCFVKNKLFHKKRIPVAKFSNFAEI